MVSGSFFHIDTLIGGATNQGVLKLNDDGSRDGSYVTRNGATSGLFGNMIVEPLTGRIVLTGGSGETVGGLQTAGFLRLLPDGTIDRDFRPAVGGSAVAIQPDGRYVIGGSFTNINGIYRFYRIDQNGITDPAYSADSGPNPTGGSNIYKMEAQPDGKIIVIGSFDAINGTPRKGFARLNTDGSLDTSFDPPIDGYERRIQGLAIQSDGKIVIAGYFKTVGPGGGPLDLYRVRRYNPDGTPDASFTTVSLDKIPTSVAVQKNTGKIVVGGLFDTVNGVPSTRVALLFPNGTVDTNFHPPAFAGFGGGSGIVKMLLPQRNGRIVIGGNFVTINGVTQRLLARLNPDGSFDTFFRPSIQEINPDIYALAQQPDGKILASAYPSNFNNSPRAGSNRLLYANRTAPFDYDGDGKADISIFRPSNGVWYVQNSSDGSFSINQFGAGGDMTVPADFDGDGRDDIAIYRPSNGLWYWLNSSNGQVGGNQFGTSGDIPVPGDYDGDGKADIAIFRPSTGTWWIYYSSSGGVSAMPFGTSGDKPARGDFDGDGKADLAVFRPSNSAWYRINSGSGALIVNLFGLSEDKPVPADYDGDGKTDIAIWRPSNGAWYIQNSSTGSIGGVYFGITEDRPIPADYDGDGKTDPAVFRPSQGTWYLLRTTAGLGGQTFGAAGDIPTPNSFVQ